MVYEREKEERSKERVCEIGGVCEMVEDGWGKDVWVFGEKVGDRSKGNEGGGSGI